MAGIDASEAVSNTHGSAKSLISAIKANERVSSNERNELMRDLERVNRYESTQQDDSRKLCSLTPFELVKLALARAVMAQKVMTLDLDEAKLTKEEI